METGSVLSEPVHSSAHRGFKTERSASMTLISSPHSNGPPPPPPQRVSQLENLEAKMANIEVSLSSLNPSRRRKGTSLGGLNSSTPVLTSSTISIPRAEMKEVRSALQDREAAIQNLRIQLGLGKLPRPSGPPLDDAERPAAEQRLVRLKNDTENKRIAIRNLKSALDKLEITTDNIDIRIRQAELEYALGREELQLLSIVEEARALQSRLDRTKPEVNSLYNAIKTTGVTLTLHAIQATLGRWAASFNEDSLGFYVEWALDGEGLFRGDRILEANHRIVVCKSKEEFQKLIGTSGKCQLVVVRRKSPSVPQQQLMQQQEDNVRLQHRISYLEEQVRELQTTKERTSPTPSIMTAVNNGISGHVTSINITSPPSTPPEKEAQVFQRGNYITTLIGGKPIELTGNFNGRKTHITKTMIKENGCQSDTENNNLLPLKSLSASKISINSDITGTHHNHNHQHNLHQHHMQQLHQQNFHKRVERERKEKQQQQQPIRNGYHIESTNNNNGELRTNKSITGSNNHHQQHSSHARSVEHLNGHSVERRKPTPPQSEQIRKFGNDLRSVKSLDFESDTNDKNQNLDYTSEPNPVGQPRIRPTPPKKPLRLSILQRAQSLQTVELNHINEADKKRPLKRMHNSIKPAINESVFIENSTPLHTASLGRQRLI